MSGVRRSLGVSGMAIAVLLALALGTPPAAEGHALLQSAAPAPGSTVGSAPTTVKLTFGEPPDPRLSSVQVLSTSGTNVASGVATVVAGDRTSLEVPLEALADGVYTVSWRTVSSIDGHVAAGSFAFGVGVTPPAGPATAATQSSTSGSPAAILARFLLYLGLIGLLGAGYVGFFVGRPGALRLDVLVRLATGAWLIAAIGSAFTVAVTWEEAGGDLGQLVGSSVGINGFARIIAIAIGALPIAVLGLVAESRRPRWLGLTGLGAVLALTVDVATGHAASDASGWFGLGAQWVHVIAVGLWMGGLLALLVATIGEPSVEKATSIRRFSTWAAPWIGLVALTGIVRAVQEVGSVPALFEQPYGQLVIGKTALLGVLAGLGSTNRWWSVPATDRTLGRIRRIGTTEIGTAVVVIALAAALVNGVPPVSLGSSVATTAAPIVATGADAGTSVRARLAITPATAGANTFDVAVTDYDSGAPVAATDVSLRFSIASRTGVGASTLDLKPKAGAAGAFTATGANLSLDGIWRITATVAQSASSAEVPFVVATTVASQRVDVLPASGTPTIYTVHLPDGTSAQAYLDPETAGHDELHATFFDASGTERPITEATVATGTGAGALLQPRLLEPGHFVAEIDAEAGILPVDVIGLDAAGGQIHVHVTLEVQP